MEKRDPVVVPDELASVKISPATVFAAAGWFLAAGWVAYASLSPTSLWMRIGPIEVGDSTVGGPSPKVTIRAEFRKTFVLRWHRILFRNIRGDEWVQVCVADGAGARYPGHVSVYNTIAELFDGHLCATKLAQANYYIEVDLEWTDIVMRTEVVESNVFSISGPAPAPSPRPYNRSSPAPAPPPPGRSTFVIA